MNTAETTRTHTRKKTIEERIREQLTRAFDCSRINDGKQKR